jgi:cyclopropane fatty-acyl-phospholipid synthase-like methyltransferase
MNVNKYVIDRLDIKPDDVVLDAGCGVGGTAIFIAEKYKSKVFGISLVKKQINNAKENAKKRNVSENTFFSVQSYNSTNFADEKFSKIYAIESACHAEDKKLFIKEAYRTLKPGGKLVVCDYFVNELNPKKDMARYNRFCSGWAMANLAKKIDYAEYLKKAGFEGLTFEDFTDIAIRTSRFMHIVAVLWYPIDLAMYLLRIIDAQTFLGTKASISQYYLFKKHALLHGIFTVSKPTTSKPGKLKD